MFLETKQLGALIMIVIFKECKQYGNEKNWNFRIDVGSISFKLTVIYAFQIIGKKRYQKAKKDLTSTQTNATMVQNYLCIRPQLAGFIQAVSAK